jgi:murein DD-endopeptidase MepM/ murein hydrolase activator NlpD
MAGGTVRSSLFSATDEAASPIAVATQLAEIFANDIDFRRELQRGATFSVVYETLTADGEPVSWGPASGRVLAAEFVNKGQTFSAMWFKDDDAKGAYFGLDGQSKQRSFLASPLEFSRVTSASRCGCTRSSTPGSSTTASTTERRRELRCARSATASSSSPAGRNGYGNVVHIQHGSERTTVYAHLSRIEVVKGQRVEQGAIIGAVGQTGWATGPHLHFEVKIDGDSRILCRSRRTSEAATITPAARLRFGQLAQSVRAQLGIAETLPRTPLLGE